MSIADSKNAVEMEVLSSDPVPPKKTKFPRLAQIVTEQATTKHGDGSVGWPATDTVATLFLLFLRYTEKTSPHSCRTCIRDIYSTNPVRFYVWLSIICQKIGCPCWV